jgi:hypothetical protein
MPLFDGAHALIRTNLEHFQPNVKTRVRGVVIGTLTDVQLGAINGSRKAKGLPPVRAEVLFFGWHVYKSRIIGDGYRIADVLDQIESAMKSESVVLNPEHMTAMENPTARADAYGNMVKDRAVFECTAHHPRPELFSVMPKGDTIRPTKKKEAILPDSLFPRSSNSPG